MKAQLLDGKKVAEQILSEVQQDAKGKSLRLVVIQVGENIVSHTYITEKQKIGQDIGIEVTLHEFPSTIAQQELQDEIESLGEAPEVTGLIVQLPLPDHIEMKEILDVIPMNKDVDVLSSAAFDQFSHGVFPVLPPTVAAVRAIFSSYGIQMHGKKIVIIGSGRLVGWPLSVWMKNEGVSFQIADKETTDIQSLTQEADIIISGVGKKNLVTGGMIKVGAVVVDAGTSVEQGKTTGDVDFESVSQKASYISPVPGGVGPVTVACLFQNLVSLSKNQ